MTRAAFLGWLASVPTFSQLLAVDEASEGYISLFNGQDLGHWQGDEQVWQAGRGLLTGTSDGKLSSY